MAPSYELPEPGDVVGDKYRISRIVATGGMARVYAAVHVRLGQSVALKILLPEIAAYAELRVRFEREARAAAQLRSPHVARVLDVDLLPSGAPYIVMELLEGCDLERELRLRTRLPSDEAVGYILQACVAMDEAHRLGTVHRDLKPSNLFLSKGAEGSGAPTLKVLDFGISKVLETGPVPVVTTVLSLLGTPHYMSPEQVRSAKGVDARSDVWSLGVILYELVTGQLPFTGDSVAAIVSSIAADRPVSLRAIDPRIAPELEAVVMKALSKDRDARYSDAGTLARALRDLSPGAPTAAGRARADRPSPVPGAGDPRADLSRRSSAATGTLLLSHGDGVASRRSGRRRALTLGGGSLALAALAMVTVVGIRSTRVGPQAARLGPASPLGAEAPLVHATLAAPSPRAATSKPVAAGVAPPRTDGVEATPPAPLPDVAVAPGSSDDAHPRPVAIDTTSAPRPDAKEKRRSRPAMLADSKRTAPVTKATSPSPTSTPTKATTATGAAPRAHAAPRDTDLPSDPG